jgi:VWFA-related protein
MKTLFAASLVVLAAAVPATGQTQTDAAPPRQDPTFRTGVELIAVDVGVVDAKGVPVEDLLAPDFLVKIDGEPRRVVSAEQVRIDVEAARREAADPFETLYTTNLKPPNGRLFVIAVDQLNIRFGAARPLLNTAAKFLDRLSPADRVAFVAYPEPGVQVGFTNDYTKVKLAMERVVGQQRTDFKGKFNIGVTEAIAIEDRGDNRVFGEVVGRECPRSRGTLLEQCERDIQDEVGNMVHNLRQNTSDSLRGLRDLLLALTTVEGPKTMILLSEGIMLDTPADLDDVIRGAAAARVTINVLLMDVPRDDISVAQLGPTVTEDRELQTRGLFDLAGGARGALYYVVGTGQTIFDRLATETLAYYMLGVEQSPDDRNGRSHRIDVEVRRRGVTVRSRRAFVLSSATTTRRNAEETLMDTLKSPFGVAEVPVRVTTFVQQEGDTDKVRLLLAAEIGQPGAAAAEYTVGYVLLDSDGKVVTAAANKGQLAPPEGQRNGVPDYFAQVILDPGNYSLRFGVVDPTGRRGGVIREVNAWKMAGEEFALGDLIVGDAGNDAGKTLRPGVEPRVQSNLGAFLELYSTSPDILAKTKVSFEIAEDQDSPALISSDAQLANGSRPTARIGQGVLSGSMLPPGRYMARARIIRDGNVAGVLVRPFILEPAPGTAAPLPFARGVVAKFDSRIALARDVLSNIFDSMEKASPELKGPLAQARAGQYSTAALNALTSGDQVAAAFFKGLDWYSKGQLDQASVQLGVAAGPRREFFPAAFYLGATFAAAGRDRDAAGIWQLALGNEPRPTLVYLLLADARLRDGSPDAVVDVLKPVYARLSTNDEIAQRLIAACLMTGRYEEALPVLDGYLSRNPTEQTALFAAVFAQYHVATKEHLVLSAADQNKLAGYVRAYKGPYQSLLQKYLQIIRGR